MPAPEVPLAILERRLEKTTSEKEKAKIEMKIMSLLRVSSARMSSVMREFFHVYITKYV